MKRTRVALTLLFSLFIIAGGIVWFISQLQQELKGISIIYFSIGFVVVFITGYIVIGLDKQTQESKHNLGFSQNLLNTAPVIVLLLDTHGYIEYVNPYFEKLCGYKLDEIKGKEWFSNFLPEYDQNRIRKLFRSAERGENVEGNVNTIVCRNGDEHLIEWYASTMEDANGKITGVLSIGMDITGQKKKEEALIKSEQRLLESQQLAHLGHWVWNIIDGNIEWSDEAYNICGIKQGEVKLNYEVFINCVHPDDREEVESNLTEALVNNNYEVKHRILYPSGEVRYVHERGKIDYDKTGKPVRMLGTIQDITEQRQAEEEIEKNRSRFEAVFESIPDAIIFTDLDRNIKMVNSATIKIFGYEEAELIGNQTKFLYASPDVFVQQGKNRFNPDSEAISTPYQVTYRCKNGQEFTGETLGVPVRSSSDDVLGYIGIIRDVTEQTQVNTILRSLAAGASSLEFESFLEEFLECLTDIYDCNYAFVGVLKKDGKSIRTIAVRAKGKPVENFEYQLKGTPCQDIINQEQRLIPRNAQDLYKEDKILVDMGIEGYFGARLTAQDGAVMGILSVMDTEPLEIVEWKQQVLDVFATRMSLELERETVSNELHRHREHLEDLVTERTVGLRSARNEAERANVAKSEFLSHMSHELRTPMNAILGFGQILELDSENFSDTQKRNIKEILDAGDYLLNLINDVLDLSKIETGKLIINMEDVVINDVIQQCVDLMHPLAESRQIKIIDNIKDKGITVRADFTRLKQVCLNLLSNAVKYNHKHGSITLDSEIINNMSLRICVTDTGIGLTEEDIAKLFRPFEQINPKNNIEGAGIGLVITKHLVELMGGTIGVKSVSGEGSQFWVELKLSRDTEL